MNTVTLFSSLLYRALLACLQCRRQAFVATYPGLARSQPRTCAAPLGDCILAGCKFAGVTAARLAGGWFFSWIHWKHWIHPRLTVLQFLQNWHATIGLHLNFVLRFCITKARPMSNTRIDSLYTWPTEYPPFNLSGNPARQGSTFKPIVALAQFLCVRQRCFMIARWTCT